MNNQQLNDLIKQSDVYLQSSYRKRLAALEEQYKGKNIPLDVLNEISALKDSIKDDCAE